EVGLVLYHHHCKQLMIGIGAVEANHRVEVRQTNVVRATRDLGHRIAGAEAAVDSDVEFVLLERAVIGGNRERRLLSLECPVENELDLLILGVARRDENSSRYDACRPSWKSLSIPAHECRRLLDSNQLRFAPTKSHGRSATHFSLARALPGKVKIGPNIVNAQIHF